MLPMTKGMIPVGFLAGLLALSGFGLGARAADTNLQAQIALLTRNTQTLLAGCQVKAKDGTTLYTPDGKAHYQALWTRDFTYMLENAGDLMPIDQVEACLIFLLNGQRADGAMPDRVTPKGVAVYAAGPEGRPLGKPNLDNPMFMVIAVDEFLKRVDSGKRTRFFQAWSKALDKGMDWIPRSEHGLVFNDPVNPHSPYGFTDCVAKTGELFMESLLYWTACERLKHWHGQVGSKDRAGEYGQRARLIEQNVNRCFSEKAGAFLAATRDCRQIDVWANAYAIALKFPLGQKRPSILKFLADNYGRYVWRGQVRHLLAGEYWERLLTAVDENRYQNGAYWAAASGWVMVALHETKPELARQMLDDLISDFRKEGICECIHTNYRQLDSYVVSAANPLGAARQLFK